MADGVDKFLAEYRAVLLKSGKTQADVERLDEQRKAAFSEALLAARKAAEKVSFAEAEHMARVSETYADAVARLDVAREACATAKAEAVYFQARFDAWRTKSATKRTEMAIEGQR
jgi:hypothetical protein